MAPIQAASDAARATSRCSKGNRRPMTHPKLARTRAVKASAREGHRHRSASSTTYAARSARFVSWGPGDVATVPPA
jgi:hypothetical protein